MRFIFIEKQPENRNELQQFIRTDMMNRMRVGLFVLVGLLILVSFACLFFFIFLPPDAHAAARIEIGIATLAKNKSTQPVSTTDELLETVLIVQNQTLDALQQTNDSLNTLSGIVIFIATINVGLQIMNLLRLRR